MHVRRWGLRLVELLPNRKLAICTLHGPCAQVESDDCSPRPRVPGRTHGRDSGQMGLRERPPRAAGEADMAREEGESAASHYGSVPDREKGCGSKPRPVGDTASTISHATVILSRSGTSRSATQRFSFLTSHVCLTSGRGALSQPDLGKALCASIGMRPAPFVSGWRCRPTHPGAGRRRPRGQGTDGQFRASQAQRAAIPSAECRPQEKGQNAVDSRGCRARSRAHRVELNRSRFAAEPPASRGIAPPPANRSSTFGGRPPFAAST